MEEKQKEVQLYSSIKFPVKLCFNNMLSCDVTNMNVRNGDTNLTHVCVLSLKIFFQQQCILRYSTSWKEKIVGKKKPEK